MKNNIFAFIIISSVITGCSSNHEVIYRIRPVETRTHTDIESTVPQKIDSEQNNLPPVQLSTPSKKAQQTIKQAILSSLKDPDSAKFRGKITLVDKTYACAEVNAKNGFGGYAGFKQFYLTKTQSDWFVLASDDSSRENCIDILHSVANKK